MFYSMRKVSMVKFFVKLTQKTKLWQVLCIDCLSFRFVSFCKDKKTHRLWTYIKIDESIRTDQDPPISRKSLRRRRRIMPTVQFEKKSVWTHPKTMEVSRKNFEINCERMGEFSRNFCHKTVVCVGKRK